MLVAGILQESAVILAQRSSCCDAAFAPDHQGYQKACLPNSNVVMIKICLQLLLIGCLCVLLLLQLCDDGNDAEVQELLLLPTATGGGGLLLLLFGIIGLVVRSQQQQQQQQQRRRSIS